MRLAKRDPRHPTLLKFSCQTIRFRSTPATTRSNNSRFAHASSSPPALAQRIECGCPHGYAANVSACSPLPLPLILIPPVLTG